MMPQDQNKNQLRRGSKAELGSGSSWKAVCGHEWERRSGSKAPSSRQQGG